MPSLLLHVDNLKCGGCSSTVRRNILELPGAVAVNVDPEAGTVRVEHDGSMEHDVVATMLFHLGYPEHGTGGWKEQAVSYLSCAVGRLRGES
jgi:copper chaperone